MIQLGPGINTTTAGLVPTDAWHRRREAGTVYLKPVPVLPTAVWLKDTSEMHDRVITLAYREMADQKDILERLRCDAFPSVQPGIQGRFAR